MTATTVEKIRGSDIRDSLSDLSSDEASSDSQEPARLAGGPVSHSSWQVLGEPHFRRYFLGSLISNLGTWLQSTAQVLIAWAAQRAFYRSRARHRAPRRAIR